MEKNFEEEFNFVAEAPYSFSFSVSYKSVCCNYFAGVLNLVAFCETEFVNLNAVVIIFSCFVELNLCFTYTEVCESCFLSFCKTYILAVINFNCCLGFSLYLCSAFSFNVIVINLTVCCANFNLVFEVAAVCLRNEEAYIVELKSVVVIELCSEI